MEESWAELADGRRRLGIVVAKQHPSVEQVERLAEIARSVDDAESFAHEVDIPARTRADVRRRLPYLRAAIKKATNAQPLSISLEELSWRLLCSIRILQIDLEGDLQLTRTQTIGRLQGSTTDGKPSSAEALFGRLVELSQVYGPRSARVTRQLLRRDLSGFPLRRAFSSERQWQVLDRLGEIAFSRVRFTLDADGRSLALPRSIVRDDLQMRLPEPSQALVVRGEADAGKSSLVVRVAREHRDQGDEVVLANLRDLPPTVLELESLIGGSLSATLAGGRTGTRRLLVVDGAEAVLETQVAAFEELARAALTEGYGVVAVTRLDGERAVTALLNNAVKHAGTGDIGTLDVPSLDKDETSTVSHEFPAVAPLFGDPRTNRLLARPGLLDLVLRTPSFSAEGPLSEADVFERVWLGLVRRDELLAPGNVAPDAREQVLTELARSALTGSRPPSLALEALPSLRSDGLVLIESAWSSGPTFATDLVRDFSVARLLAREGWSSLVSSGPRWAIRATRLACQGRLSRAGADRRREWGLLVSEFDEIAERHGQRWKELPIEGLLTLGDARATVAELWSDLVGGDRSVLATMLRLAEQRYTSHGNGDVLVLRPIVEFAYCGEVDLGQHNLYAHRGLGEAIQKLVLAWLNGLIQDGTPEDALRKRVRDVALEHADSSRPSDFVLQLLSSLGPDLNQQVEALLQATAEQSPDHLDAVVDEIGPIVALSASRVDLLLRLAETYFIERRRPRRRTSSRIADFDDDWDLLHRNGIRDIGRPRGLGVPLATWWLGPFFRLLNVRPLESLAFINRMLDHAVRPRTEDSTHADLDKDDLETGVVLGFGTVAPRHCAGPVDAWAWYRGSTAGPYTCVSALLAVERFADHLIAQGIPIHRVAEVLMQDCHNMAMPGLVAGMLVRHAALDQLDRWLAEPALWHVEFSRVAAEGVLHVQGPDGDDVVGRDRRRYSFREVAAEMTINAATSGNQVRLGELDEIGIRLVENARKSVGESDADGRAIALVENWAAAFRPANYKVEATDAGISFEFAAPDDVRARLQPTDDEIERTTNGMRLLNLYSRDEARDARTDTLGDDIVTARSLSEHGAGRSYFVGPDPIAAVAATAIMRVFLDEAVVAVDDIRWATDVLIDAALDPALNEFSIPESFFSQGADRSAAAGLPAAGFVSGEADPTRYLRALGALGRSVFDEVRAAFVTGARPTWARQCLRLGGRCLHESIWEAIEAGLADCVMSDRGPDGKRGLASLGRPYAGTLSAVKASDLLLNRLHHVLVAASDASASESCVARRARELLPVMLEANRSVVRLWAEKRYGQFGDRDRRRVVRVLLAAAANGDHGPLLSHLDAFADSGAALQQLLSDASITVTYDSSLRRQLPSLWPPMMETVLAAWEKGRVPSGRDHWIDYAVSSVLPTPSIETSDRNVDETLAVARREWISPHVIDGLIVRWLPYGLGQPKAVDALVGLTRCAEIGWQVGRGLELVEEAASADYGEVASRSWFLPEWLSDIRGLLEGTGQASRWRRIVDGLAAAGDSRASQLQQVEE